MEDESCIVRTFGPTPTIKITGNNDLIIEFDYPLKNPLSESDIVSLNITGDRSDGYDFTWKLV